jgi:hypothetical protein
MCVVKPKDKYFKTKYRPAGILLTVNAVIFYRFKLKLKFRNKNHFSVIVIVHTCLTGIVQSAYRLATGWTVRGSKPGGDEIFRTRPGRPWGPLSLLYNVYGVSFPGVKRSGRGVNHARLKKE